jgi:hypothetical protein
MWGIFFGAILQPSQNRFRAKRLSRAGSAPTPAGARPRSPHQKNPLPYFLNFPRRDFFFSCKGCFLVAACRFSDLAYFLCIHSVSTQKMV